MSTDLTPEGVPCSPAGAEDMPLSPAWLAALPIREIRVLAAAADAADGSFWSLLEGDRRTGVRALAVRYRRRAARDAAEQMRLASMLRFERRYWGRGLTMVAGVDEVGRGCLAGPVVAAAVVLPKDVLITHLDDSKKLTPQRRTQLDAQIRAISLGVGVGEVAAPEIDRSNIQKASLRAMRTALHSLPQAPEQVLVDGRALPGSGFPEVSLVDGDARSLCIAAASVVAKVYRDNLMVAYDQEYPQYGFARHKGYGSPQHLSALAEHGCCPLHRRSFAPVAQRTAGWQEQTSLALATRLRRCRTCEELAHVGATIQAQAQHLDGEQVECLRRLYRALRARLRQPGIQGEELAARYLEDQGGRVLARRYRGAGGEIDLVVRAGGELVFVEVKSCSGTTLGATEERVGADKRQRLARAARHYLQRWGGAEIGCRFDVVTVDLSAAEPRIVHLRDAFRP